VPPINPVPGTPFAPNVIVCVTTSEALQVVAGNGGAVRAMAQPGLLKSVHSHVVIPPPQNRTSVFVLAAAVVAVPWPEVKKQGVGGSNGWPPTPFELNGQFSPNTPAPSAGVVIPLVA